MRLLQLLLAALVLALPSLPAHARSAVLADPAPVAIPAGLSQEQVVKDIKRALIGRGWAISSQAPGQIESTLNLRDHEARIRVTYDSTQVQLAYLDSRNLDYREKRGQRLIHSNYLGWIGFLVKDLDTNFKVSAAGG